VELVKRDLSGPFIGKLLSHKDYTWQIAGTYLVLLSKSDKIVRKFVRDVIKKHSTSPGLDSLPDHRPRDYRDPKGAQGRNRTSDTRIFSLRLASTAISFGNSRLARKRLVYKGVTR
jgi:hypothetical protein